MNLGQAVWRFLAIVPFLVPQYAWPGPMPGCRAWSEDCANSTCRAGLLLAALRIGLGATPGPAPPGYTASHRSSGGFGAAARAVAECIPGDDLQIVDLMLRERAGPGESLSLPCRPISKPRFTCTWRGYRLVGVRGAGGVARIESLTLPGGPPSAAFALPGDVPPRARARDGRRVEFLTIESDTANLRLVDDLTILQSGLARSVAADARALGPGPLQTKAVFKLIVAVLGDTDH